MIHVSYANCLQHDVNLAGYKKHVVSQHAPKPLTFAEEELELIKRTEARKYSIHHHLFIIISLYRWCRCVINKIKVLYVIMYSRI